MAEERKTTRGQPKEARAEEEVVLTAPYIPKGAYLVCLPPLGRTAGRHPCAFAEFSSTQNAEVALSAILRADRARGGSLGEGDFVIVQR